MGQDQDPHTAAAMHDRRIIPPDRPHRGRPPAPRPPGRPERQHAAVRPRALPRRWRRPAAGHAADLAVPLRGPAPRGRRHARRAVLPAGRLGPGRAARPLRVPTARRALKAAEYPLDWLLALAQIARRPDARPDVVHVQWSVQPKLDLLVWRAVRRLGMPLVYTAHNLLPAPRPSRRTRPLRSPLPRGRRPRRPQRAQRPRPPRARGASPPSASPSCRTAPSSKPSRPIERQAARRQLGLPPDAEVVLFAGPDRAVQGAGRPDRGVRPAWPRAARRPDSSSPASRTSRSRRTSGSSPRSACSTAPCWTCASCPELGWRPTSAPPTSWCCRTAPPPPAGCCSRRAASAGRSSRPTSATWRGRRGRRERPAGAAVSPGPLAVAIERLLADPGLAARLGAAGQRAAAGPESWAEAARRTVALYRRLLGRSPAPSRSR